jgi:chromosome segregation ATPase
MRRKPQGIPPSPEEVANDLVKDYEKDDRSLEELRERKEELDKEIEEIKMKQKGREELYDEITDEVKAAEKRADQVSKVSKEDVRQVLNWFNYHFIQSHDPRRFNLYEHPKVEEARELEGKIKGGELKETDKSIEEVF